MGLCVQRDVSVCEAGLHLPPVRACVRAHLQSDRTAVGVSHLDRSSPAYRLPLPAIA